MKIKLPEPTITRLIDLIVYSHMESKATNQSVHREYRILVKKRAYIRYMKQDAELFKGKKEILEAKSLGKNQKEVVEACPDIWNSSIEGDELC